jgi:hypothetical protein
MLTAPAQAATSTTVVVFEPWTNGTLRDGFTVLHRAHGSCFTHSLSTDRPVAWRCFEGDDIWDPCFAESEHSVVVACAESPFSHTVELLSLEKPLSDGDNPTTKWLQPKAMPWGLRLTGGDTCVFATGATDAVRGDRLNYACRKTGWIIGAPDRSTAMWTARSVRWPNKHITRVSIATAVF